jgi:hypothetical protein
MFFILPSLIPTLIRQVVSRKISFLENFLAPQAVRERTFANVGLFFSDFRKSYNIELPNHQSSTPYFWANRALQNGRNK